ncbi:uncharacterized protein PHACADRAFT_151948 [Phanerochaete carnosa HHB-10118-sp]|uniref:ASX DEUBAD domain-containing protein n=1 Tax=Phanerochaete carnosa (strain HHB-10118-sp) TaxID=650164 RepID=K5UNI9_PHACS|nr:uncharacterized protein PHACADRAFT_151948 [Phanerochaete carnosa HHB-10118-sp]EKM51291.1 hypothetical protein PHACADRAFT_151948 [Phanerochaete carnosa HHB-10118-sp]
MSPAGTSDRPRRSTRAPAKAVTIAAPASPAEKKGKQRDPEAQLEHLLTNSRSKLTTIDIADVISYENFLDLSEESKELLCSLLPPTAFLTHIPSVNPSHPSGSVALSSTWGADIERSPATLDPAFFTSPFLLGAAHAWQDHIYSGFFSAKSQDSLAKYSEGVHNGMLRAEWKDEAWMREHPPPKRPALYKEDLDIIELVKSGVIREGDVIAYKRHFPNLSITVEKDMLVQKANPADGTLAVLLQPGSAPSLPQDLLVVAPPNPTPPTLTIEDILSSMDLEDALLDVDGRISRDQRAVTPITKALTVFRWRDEVMCDLEMQMSMEKGARERCGSVWYLRRS